MVEQVGSGVPRIRKAMLESDLPAPEFRTEGLFTLVLSREKLRKNEVKTREETREEIMRIIKESPKITMRQIAAQTGLTPKGVEYHIRKMREEELLKRVGSTKSGSWEIKKRD